jgi:chaperonin GroES
LQIKPLADRVLVKVAEAEAVTAGGIILAESAQRKPTSGA